MQWSKCISTLCIIALCCLAAWVLSPLVVDGLHPADRNPVAASHAIEKKRPLSPEMPPSTKSPPSPETPLPTKTQPSPEALAALKKIEPHMDVADRAAGKAAGKAIRRIGEFFDQRRTRARAFAERALSFRSKWEYVKDTIGFGQGHHHFLHEEFEAKVFSQQELADLLKSVVEEYLETIKGIENTFLVAVRADLEDMAPPELRGAAWMKTDEAFRGEFATALKKVTGKVTTDLGVMIGREAATWIAADIAANIGASLCITVAQRMGVSAAITGSGLATGAVTLGLGLVAGLIIDTLLDWMIQAMGYDPVADVEDQISLLIDEFEGVFLWGDSYKPIPVFSLFPNDREDRMFEKQMKRWEKLLERRKSSAVKCRGFFVELGEVYETRADMQYDALRNLILKGDQ